MKTGFSNGVSCTCCPFCGGTNVLTAWGENTLGKTYAWAVCGEPGCSATGPKVLIEDDNRLEPAIHEWNGRCNPEDGYTHGELTSWAMDNGFVDRDSGG